MHMYTHTHIHTHTLAYMNRYGIRQRQWTLTPPFMPCKHWA